MPITDPNQEYFKDGGWSWTGSKWIKGGLAFEYAGQLFDQIHMANATDAWEVLVSGMVPVGEIWIVTAMLAQNANSAVTGRFLGVQKGAVNLWLATDAGGGTGTAFSWSGIMVLIEGDRVAGGLQGCTVNDDLYVDWIGYRMRLT